mmetsp:Transcript_28722/g.93343  ORF Transcript_28722/g.93343 Transcript_28722/m.93343 type:complete len:204 (-) Transcript_28722:31-642(-)
MAMPHARPEHRIGPLGLPGASREVQCVHIRVQESAVIPPAVHEQLVPCVVRVHGVLSQRRRHVSARVRGGRPLHRRHVQHVHCSVGRIRAQPGRATVQIDGIRGACSSGIDPGTGGGTHQHGAVRRRRVVDGVVNVKHHHVRGRRRAVLAAEEGPPSIITVSGDHRVAEHGRSAAQAAIGLRPHFLSMHYSDTERQCPEQGTH